MSRMILGIALLWATVCQGQVKPTFFPEDILTEGFEGKCFCKPGVENKSRSRGLSITYGQTNSAGYVADGDTPTFSNPLSTLSQLNQFELKLKIPVLLKERTKVLLSYKYYLESYNFESIGVDFPTAFEALDQQSLKSNDYGIILSHSLNEENYLIFRYKYGSNGNYTGWTNFNSQFAIHSVLGMYGIKKTDDFEWGIGFFFTKSFRQTSGLPFVLYNRNFNDKWGIEAMFPANVFLRHNISKKTLATIGFEYNSKSFRLAETDALTGIDYAFNHAEIIPSINLERHLTSWIWANVRLGYQVNFSSEFLAKSDAGIDFQADPGSGWFFNVGVFISPDLDKKEQEPH